MKAHDIDFDTLNAKVTIQQVAEQMLGTRLKPYKDELRGCCPISQTTNPRHFCVTPALNRFVCFCDECKKFKKRGGDAIELVRRVRHYEAPLQAAREIEKYFGITADKTDQPAQQPSASKRDFDAAAYQKKLQPDHEALKHCQISPETIHAWGGGYVIGNGALGGRLALPLCDIEGRFVDFVGIALKDEEPGLKFPQGVTPPSFFGVDRIQEERNLHVVYHPLDVLRYAEDGYNVIAILAPITREVLTDLAHLMDAKKITDLEFH